MLFDQALLLCCGSLFVGTCDDDHDHLNCRVSLCYSLSSDVRPLVTRSDAQECSRVIVNMHR